MAVCSSSRSFSLAHASARCFVLLAMRLSLARAADDAIVLDKHDDGISGIKHCVQFVSLPLPSYYLLTLVDLDQTIKQRFVGFQPLPFLIFFLRSRALNNVSITRNELCDAHRLFF